MKQTSPSIFGSFFFFASVFGLLCNVGCQKIPKAEPVILITSDTTDISVKNFDKCVLTYSIHSTSLLPQLLRQATDSSTRAWVANFPKVTFQEVSNEYPADIRIEITDSDDIVFPSVSRNDLLHSGEIESKSIIRKTENGTISIVLNGRNNWLLPTLTGTVTHLLGRAMGLAISNLSGDIMYPYISENSRLRPSANDIEKLTALYPEECNGWRIRRKAPSLPFQNVSNIYSQPISFNFDNNDTLYLLWPKASNAEWGFYKILLAQQPSEDLWLESVGITASSLEMSRVPVNLFAVKSEGRVFVGPGQRFSNSSGHNLYEYVPSKGTFILQNATFNTANGIYTSSLAGTEKYVYTIDMSDPGQASLIDFSISAGQLQMQRERIPFELYTHTVGFYAAGDIPCLYTGHIAIFREGPSSWRQTIFDPGNPNVFKEPRNSGNEQSFKTFTIGKESYLIRDNFGWPHPQDPYQTPVDLWRLDFSLASSRFQFHQHDSQHVEGKVLLLTSHKGTGLMFTSDGGVYQFVP